MDIRITRLFKIMAIAATFVVAGSYISSAQDYTNTPVSISKDKVRINGQVCYSHVVLERQTLFSISKAYNVSIDDIYRLNPSLKESGLVKNSIIIIPVIEESTSNVIVKEETSVKEQVKNEGKGEETKKKKKKTHTVKWYENIDDIAGKYGVTAEEIMAANNLSSRKLKSRMKLTIPEPGEMIVETTTEPVLSEIQMDTVRFAEKQEKENIESEEDDSPWWAIKHNEKVTASLLLPFKATGTAGSRSNMDFYSGVLLAINDLGQNGTSVDLNVYDIADGNYEPALRNISGSDLVIGPVSVRDINAVLPSTNSVLISPLDPKAENLTQTHRNLLQAPTPHKLQYEDMAAWIKEDCKTADHVLLISEKGARLTEASLEMRQAVDSAGITYKTFSYSILEGRDVERPLKELMTQTAVNRVVIVSESEAFVNDVVRNLNMMIHQKYNIVLYAASKIRSFETIEVDNFHKTNMHVSLTYYIDYNDERVKNFLLKYRALFNAEPSQFAFQGYDIASYFISMNAKYGKDWLEKLSKEETAMLQSTFRCIQNGEGGYVNQGIRRIVYEKNWTISKIK